MIGLGARILRTGLRDMATHPIRTSSFMARWKFSLERLDNEAVIYWPVTKIDPPSVLADAVKVSFLSHLCRKQGRKVIVFTEWLFTQWLVELATRVLCFGVLVICAKHKYLERAVALEEFNRKGSDVDGLITSTELGKTD